MNQPLSAARVEVAEATAPKAPEESITVVGIGADGFDELGHTAQTVLRRAEVVIGSWRQLNLIPDSIRAERRPWPSPMLPAIEPLFHEYTGMRIAVLASGDPMFHGVGSTLKRVLGIERIRVIPHSSSASLACARLGWALDVTPVSSLVSREVETLIPLIDSGIRFLVLGRDERSAPDIARLLVDMDHPAHRITVLSDLDSPDEEIARGSAAQPPQPVSSLNVIAIEPPPGLGTGTRSLLPGLGDDSFEHDGQLTKSDIRALTVSALAPRPGEVLWDIGAGSGSIAIEWLRALSLSGGPRGQAICFESDPDRAARITRNAARLGVPWLKVMGAAPKALNDARYEGLAPDAIFIGGGVGVDKLPETAWTLLRPGGRIVANAVTIESEQTLIRLRATHGGSLRRIQVSTEHRVGGFTAFKSALPITQWRASKAIFPEGVF
ncbi:precorrin-6y C5,15-methyltransferase (decarboxylating) subunit CbiE [Corynebacterium pacaense]|uniref:precorrin-6y C5,15-methyltransferase (decarboxylating) subunit CbiE n=1 Tax=Corynebacterium pacaense TaxID=1816684 RepID=UPI0009BB6414|nr:precorrin-6y C5,15-methyltransferase (decarboxylating) subunit CbiE [Corynebacterium pacaense]